MKEKPICPYCGAQSNLVTGDQVYPHRPDLYDKIFYLCAPCGAYVGIHQGTLIPLGRLANASLRKLKSAAHAAFDPIWKTGKMRRGQAYAWLTRQLEMKSVHIGEADEELCKKIIDICKASNRV